MRLDGRKMIRRLAVSIAIALTLAGAARASDIACAGPAIGVSTVAERDPAIGSIGAVRPALALTGRSPAAVRLAGVVLPSSANTDLRTRLSLALAGFEGAAVEIHGGEQALDRRQRLTGQVASGERWLQHDLLRAGLVAFDGSGDDCAPALAAAEDEARRTGLGIWADGAALRTGSDPEGLPDFVVIEGRVKSIGKAGRTTYLNFGSDFRRDLTVVIPGRTLAGFPPEKEPSLLEGRLVRVRGWALPVSGIELNASGPAAIDLVAEPVEDKGTTRR